jgi:hypothetical protein
MLLLMGIDVDHHVAHVGEAVEDAALHLRGDLVGI